MRPAGRLRRLPPAGTEPIAEIERARSPLFQVGPALRILIVVAVVSIALVAAGLAAVAHFVAWDDYRDELTAQAEAMTGGSVAIEGPIDLDLLPRPTLTLAETTLASQ